MIFLKNKNFYEEYAKDMADFQKLSLVLDAVKSDFDTAVSDKEKNSIIADTQSYHRIPIRSIETENLIYDMTRALLDHNFTEQFGLGKRDTPISVRLHNWSVMPWRQKIPVLESLGQYVQVSYDGVSPVIINLEVWTDDDKKLELNYDYSFSGDKIFFFDNDSSPIFHYKVLYIKNIVVDTDIAEKKIKQFMPFEYIDAYSKPQYTAILKSFIKTAALGSQVGVLNDALKSFEPETFSGSYIEAFDFYSASPAQKSKYWGMDDNKNWKPSIDKYSIFDAIINLPSEYMKDLTTDEGATITRLDYLTDFLNMIKPAHIRIHPTVLYSFVEQLNLSKSDKIKIRVRVKHIIDEYYDRSDKQFFEDTRKERVIVKHTETAKPLSYLSSVYDKRTRYDAGQIYDAYSTLEDGLEKILENYLVEITKGGTIPPPGNDVVVDTPSLIALADMVTISIIDKKLN